ncbi:MAG: sensor domain-containing diguanylate cyclase [Oscillospiraceae bacterium]|jgi:diguanylate cyclase (GGDEF)-like protein/PAS domain S-box-containing protein|nr:sensor domain-containing diguanylate cyclase [Oscillospiraceae bacterium]
MIAVGNKRDREQIRFGKIATTALIVEIAVNAIFCMQKLLETGALSPKSGYAALTAVIAVSILATMIVRQSRHERIFAPFVALAAFFIFGALTDDFRLYYLMTILACMSSLMYMNSFGYFLHVILATVIIIILMANGIAVTGLTEFVSVSDVLMNWALVTLFLATSLILAFVTTIRSARVMNADYSLRSLFSSTPNMMAILDEYNRVMYISAPMLDMTSLSNDQMAVNRPLFDLFPDMEFRLMIGEAIAHNGFYENVFQLTIRGERRHLRLNFDKFRDGENKSFIDISDITPVVEARERAKIAAKKAEHDALTGLWNRDTFYRHVDEYLSMSGSVGAFFMIDVDYFKTINDTFGHSVGDDVLCEVAHVLAKVIRSTDYSGRQGGDEFVLFFKGIEPDAAERKAIQICEQFRAITPTGSDSYHVSASIGISIVPTDGTSYQELYENADAALYNVKERGRDGYAFYSSWEVRL